MKRIGLSCARYSLIALSSAFWGLTKDDLIFLLGILVTIISLIIDYLKIRQNNKEG